MSNDFDYFWSHRQGPEYFLINFTLIWPKYNHSQPGQLRFTHKRALVWRKQLTTGQPHQKC